MINYKPSLLNIVTDGEDYKIDSTTVKVETGEISKSLTINIVNDDIAECAESFKLMLSIPSPPCEVVSGEDDTSEVMIKDDDGRSISGYVVLLMY